MGTNGFVVVQKDFHHRNGKDFIMAVTSDGMCDNLLVLAKQLMKTAKKLNVLEAFGNAVPNVVIQVMQEVATATDGWAFVDILNNAQFVSYAVILHPATGMVQRWEGNLDEFLGQEELS